MSSRRLLIAGIAGGAVAGVALFALALAVVAVEGAALGGQLMAVLVLGTMLGFVLDAAWITLLVDRMSKLGGDGEDDAGDGRSGQPGPGPVPPSPPADDADWWPAFERDLAAYSRSEHAATM